MMNWICSIPDSIGWVMVGVVGTFAIIMLYKLGCLFAEMWRDYHEEECEE